MYRALFFNHAGQVFSEQTFEADDDQAAQEHARRAFSAQTGMGYELRQGKCLIARTIFGSASKAA